jgi:NAD(P)-dependent dehydrogenase (short-subunit alcohol dehydrogenase family)
VNRIHPKDSLVVITGAGSGIGAAVALLYAELGATVVAVDINESSALLTAQACCAGGGNAYGYACNVADASAVDEIANRVEQVHGPVDVLVNNAGVGVGGPFLDGSLDDWIWLRSVNIDGVVHGCRAFGPAMVERGRGHVVNIASGAGYVPNKRMATYCASKAAVIMLSRCLRADWASGGVGVSVICPGVINTAIAERARLRGSAIDERDRITKAFRMSHSPDAVAEAVVGAVSHNRAIVSVGIEAQVAYHLLRLLPAPVHDLVARI